MASIELFVDLETDPMAKERIKLLPAKEYRAVMKGYGKWRKKLDKLIPPSYIPHIFEPYQKSKPEKQAVCPHCPYFER